MAAVRMKRPAPSRSTAAAVSRPSADQQLVAFIEKFDPAVQKQIRAARRAMRKRLPTANELVYDNYNFFVIGYSPTERPSDAVLSLTGSANGVGLCFIHGARLPDPDGILQGAGKQTRFIHLDSMKMLAAPAVAALIDAAVTRARVTFAPSGRGRLIISSISARQRPRRRG